MLRPTTRLLTLLELLQARGQMTGPELAARLEVDPRTVRRYIAMLEELGIPLTAGRGRDGGYQLVAGFKLPPMMFTDDEIEALVLGSRWVATRADSRLALAADHALAKIAAVLPPERAEALDWPTMLAGAGALGQRESLSLPLAQHPHPRALTRHCCRILAAWRTSLRPSPHVAIRAPSGTFAVPPPP